MKKIIYVVLILALVGIVFISTKNNKQKTEEPKNNIETKNLFYKNSDSGLEFYYPEDWGNIVIKEGNKICPEEDAYSSADTLRIYDKEYSFNEIRLPNSQSFIRTGVRTYLLDPQNINSCGDEFHLKIAKKEIIPETLSSFKLNSITLESGLSGTENKKVVSLNTTSRTQYTFFILEDNQIYIIQTYMSFIPYADSPELIEMEKNFGGNIDEYIKKGETSKNIRKYFEEFTEMTKSLNYSKR